MSPNFPSCSSLIKAGNTHTDQNCENPLEDWLLAWMRDLLLSCPATGHRQLTDDKSADFPLTTHSLFAHHSTVIITQANDNNGMGSQIKDIKNIPRTQQIFTSHKAMSQKEVKFPPGNVWMASTCFPIPPTSFHAPFVFHLKDWRSSLSCKISTNVTLKHSNWAGKIIGRLQASKIRTQQAMDSW